MLLRFNFVTVHTKSILKMANANVMIALSAMIYFLLLLLKLFIEGDVFDLIHIVLYLYLLHLVFEENAEKTSVAKMPRKK